MLSDQPILGHVKTTKVRIISVTLAMEEKGQLEFPDSCLHFSNILPIEPSAQDLGLGYPSRTEELQKRSPHSIAA